jgi:hypothetical protein
VIGRAPFKLSQILVVNTWLLPQAIVTPQALVLSRHTVSGGKIWRQSMVRAFLAWRAAPATKHTQSFHAI